MADVNDEPLSRWRSSRVRNSTLTATRYERLRIAKSSRARRTNVRQRTRLSSVGTRVTVATFVLRTPTRSCGSRKRTTPARRARRFNSGASLLSPRLLAPFREPRQLLEPGEDRFFVADPHL